MNFLHSMELPETIDPSIRESTSQNDYSMFILKRIDRGIAAADSQPSHFIRAPFLMIKSVGRGIHHQTNQPSHPFYGHFFSFACAR